MEVSIDLSYLKKIFFNDDSLLPELIEEWIPDVQFRLQKIYTSCSSADPALYKNLHELKTSFAMLHFLQGIQCIEKLILQIENGKSAMLVSDLDELKVASEALIYTLQQAFLKK